MATAIRNLWPRVVATHRLWFNQYEEYGQHNNLRAAFVIGVGSLWYLIHRSSGKKEAKKQLKVKEKPEIIKEALGRASVTI